MNALFLLACAFSFVALIAGQAPEGAPNDAAVAGPPAPNEQAAPTQEQTQARALYGNDYQKPSVYTNLGVSTGYAAPQPVVVNPNFNQNPVTNPNLNSNTNPGYINPGGPEMPVQPQGLSAVDASKQLVAAAVAQGANPNNFGVQTGAHYTIATQPNVENPDVWDALDVLRGRGALTIDEVMNILAVAVAGKDYPIYNDIPSTDFTCEKTHQAGFYADVSAQCQVIRRCDINGVLWSYLCPNMTLFNQITLVCDWFFNVNCNNAMQFYDYANPRLYTQFALFDTPANNVVPVSPNNNVVPVSPNNNVPISSTGPRPYPRPIRGPGPVMYPGPGSNHY